MLVFATGDGIREDSEPKVWFRCSFNVQERELSNEFCQVIPNVEGS